MRVACGMLAALLLSGMARGANVYVVPTNAAAAEPYDTWAKAAASIQAAVAYASDRLPDVNTVVISNGIYTLTNTIVIGAGITVRGCGEGLGSASNAVLRAGSPRMPLLAIEHAGAVVAGLTLEKANARCVNMRGGLMRDCIIQYNSDGVSMRGGTLSNCLVRGNAHGGGGAGVGVWADRDSRILNCRIIGNSSRDVGTLNGGGVFANDASVLIRNCLIAGNRAKSRGGGVYGGTVENCTIVGNRSAVGENPGPGGGTCNSTVINSIVYGNFTGPAWTNNNNWFDCTFSYSCTLPLPDAGDGNTAADPLFVNPASGDYRLQDAPVRSPCINKGWNLNWMMAPATDLAGRPRVFLDIVDMGAYECWPAAPMIQSAGVSRLADTTATVRGNLTWEGAAEPVLMLYHGPHDGGANRQSWASVSRLPGAARAGVHEVAIAHAAGARTWCYRWYATNAQGESWAPATCGLMLGQVGVKATRRESTEEAPAAFLITRPDTATNGPLDVYFTLGGTGVNGVDYDWLESPVMIPAGATEVRLPVVPTFNMGEARLKGVELTLAPGGYLIGPNSKASMVTKPQ